MKLKPTPATEKGTQTVWQCSYCGSVICSTRGKPATPCSACVRYEITWLKQELPVATFDN